MSCLFFLCGAFLPSVRPGSRFPTRLLVMLIGERAISCCCCCCREGRGSGGKRGDDSGDSVDMRLICDADDPGLVATAEAVATTGFETAGAQDALLFSSLSCLDLQSCTGSGGRGYPGFSYSSAALLPPLGGPAWGCRSRGLVVHEGCAADAGASPVHVRGQGQIVKARDAHDSLCVGRHRAVDKLF